MQKKKKIKIHTVLSDGGKFTVKFGLKRSVVELPREPCAFKLCIITFRAALTITGDRGTTLIWETEGGFAFMKIRTFTTVWGLSTVVWSRRGVGGTKM